MEIDLCIVLSQIDCRAKESEDGLDFGRPAIPT